MSLKNNEDPGIIIETWTNHPMSFSRSFTRILISYINFWIRDIYLFLFERDKAIIIERLFIIYCKIFFTSERVPSLLSFQRNST